MGFVDRYRVIQRAKRILRREVAGLLYMISDEDKRRQALEVYKKLFDLPDYQNAARISCYISTGLEMDTIPIFVHAFKHKKTCFVPRYSFRKKKMDMVRVLDMHDLNTIKSKRCNNVYNVKHSEIRDDAIATGGLDLIIASGLAFTKEGKRLGSGGGYYDDYLKALFDRYVIRPSTVGLAYEEQLFPYLPTHFRDISIDYVISPSFSVKRVTLLSILMGKT